MTSQIRQNNIQQIKNNKNQILNNDHNRIDVKVMIFSQNHIWTLCIKDQQVVNNQENQNTTQA